MTHTHTLYSTGHCLCAVSYMQKFLLVKYFRETPDPTKIKPMKFSPQRIIGTMKIVHITNIFYEYGSATVFETYPQSSRSKHVPPFLVSV